MSMRDFLQAIPAAASSGYALVAYAICAALFVLAGAKLRTVRAVLKAIALVPEGDRKHVIESITGSVIPEKISADDWIRHNRERWIFLLVATALILLAAIASIAAMQPARPGKPPSADEARQAALAWLAKSDLGSYKVTYAEMDESFRESYSIEWWLQASERYRTPLGRVEQRVEATAAPSEFSFKRPLNGYTLMYFTKFENMNAPIREVVALVSSGVPEPWRISGYTLDVPPGAPFLAASTPSLSNAIAGATSTPSASLPASGPER
jgi:hypothetical protein